MDVRVWYVVNVDVCDVHGVWFDRGELVVIAMRLKSSTGGDRAELVIPKANAPHVPSWARVGGAGAVAAGGAAVAVDGDALDLGLDILDALLD